MTVAGLALMIYAGSTSGGANGLVIAGSVINIAGLSVWTGTRKHHMDKAISFKGHAVPMPERKHNVRLEWVTWAFYLCCLTAGIVALVIGAGTHGVAVKVLGGILAGVVVGCCIFHGHRMK